MRTIIIPPKQKFRRRTLVITGFSLTLLLLPISKAIAQSSLKKVSGVLNQASGVTSTLQPVLGDSGNQIQGQLNGAESYLSQASQYWNQLASFYSNLIGGNLQGILGNLQSITGELGIPDPFAIRAQGEWNEQVSGTFSTTQAKANTTDRAVTAGIASSILAKDGQTAIKDQQDQMTAIVGQSADAAQQSDAAATDAQSRNVTQEVMKDIAAQEAFMAQQQTATAQINQQMSEQLTGLQLQGAASNLMLADISGALDLQDSQHRQAQQADNLSEAQTAAQVFIPGIKFSQ